jgi:RNA polymerase sigma-70 factor (ECF subfamily)
MNKVTAPQSTGFNPQQLVETHQAGVWRYLRALGCSPAEADDITQETFLAVLRKPFDDYNRAATAAYLRKAAYNLFITAKRKAGRVNAVEDVEVFDESWESWVTNDNGEAMLDALAECLRALTERARWALEMRFQEKLSRLDIADKLGITEHGAKNLMQRAKKQLKSCIEGKVQ